MISGKCLFAGNTQELEMMYEINLTERRAWVQR
jgi:hypothetical protein